MTGFAPGDAVYGQCAGSFAEFARAKAARLTPKPENLTFAQAAAVPVSGVIALQALRTKAGLRSGQKVLVIDASGGVGSFAVQLAAADGADVTDVCGPDAATVVRDLGAVDVIDYIREEITDRPTRYHVILDAAGNRPLPLLRRALAPDGTLVHVGGENPGRWSVGLGTQLGMALASPFLRQNLRNRVAVVRQKDLLALKSLLESGDILPLVDSTYRLPEAPAA